MTPGSATFAVVQRRAAGNWETDWEFDAAQDLLPEEYEAAGPSTAETMAVAKSEFDKLRVRKAVFTAVGDIGEAVEMLEKAVERISKLAPFIALVRRIDACSVKLAQFETGGD